MATKENSGIYKITSPSGKIYIGQTLNFKIRFQKYRLLHCKGQIRLYNSFKKHGVNEHVFEIIDICPFNEMNNKERYYQDMYDVIGINGLNCKLTNTNELKGRHSEDTKIKISNSHKGKKLTSEHRGNLKKAKQNISKETREKMRVSRLGKRATESTRRKMSVRMIGNTYTKGKVPVNARRVVNTQNGEVYDSSTIAANEIGIQPRTLRAKLDGQNKNNTQMIYYYGT